MRITQLNSDRQALAEMFYGIGVEVGVANGDFATKILTHNLVNLLYGVDPYEPHQGYTDYTRGTTFNNMRKNSIEQLKPFGARHAFIYRYSMDAVKDFADDSLDFVYIDANHHYDQVMEDITEWTKKVKKGGFVAGDDYIKEVEQAVLEYCEANGKYLNVFNGSTPKQWMFVK